MVTMIDSELEITASGETEKEARRNLRIMRAEATKAEKQRTADRKEADTLARLNGFQLYVQKGHGRIGQTIQRHWMSKVSLPSEDIYTHVTLETFGGRADLKLYERDILAIVWNCSGYDTAIILDSSNGPEVYAIGTHNGQVAMHLLPGITMADFAADAVPSM